MPRRDSRQAPAEGVARTEAARTRLVLVPASPRGWFGGRALCARGVIEARDRISLEQAAHALERQFDGGDSALTAVLATYDDGCTLVRFAEIVEADDFDGSTSVASGVDPLLVDAVWDLQPRQYRAAVEETRERIAAGDVYVLNLTARLEGVLAVDGPEVAFERLLQHASAEMAALLTDLPGEFPWVASASPERFLRVNVHGPGDGAARIAEISPIKGTRPRGATSSADAALAAALVSDDKERAEHVMIVDLERNDLGRVCVPGSVHVDPLYEVLTTPYCHQLVSSVRGTLRPDASFAELLRATFPCGSVTGAPKRAAIRIASELEASPRGAYCGALLVAVPGELDSSVLIRTLEGVAGEPGRARYGSGGGVTHDSDPATEHLEALLKACLVTGDNSPEQALRETMRVCRGRIPLLERHLQRLARGGAGPTVLARVRSVVAEQLEAGDAAAEYARLGVTVTPDGSVVGGSTAEPSSLAIEGGPVLVPVEMPESPELPRGAAKPASRRYWDRAHRRARLAGGHQALVHDASGRLIDGSTATVWLVSGGRLSTPLAPPAVGGVARELVFDIADELGIPAVEALLTLAEFETADEVFLSNAVGLVVPVRGRGGSLTSRIETAARRDF